MGYVFACASVVPVSFAAARTDLCMPPYRGLGRGNRKRAPAHMDEKSFRGVFESFGVTGCTSRRTLAGAETLMKAQIQGPAHGNPRRGFAREVHEGAFTAAGLRMVHGVEIPIGFVCGLVGSRGGALMALVSPAHCINKFIPPSLCVCQRQHAKGANRRPGLHSARLMRDLLPFLNVRCPDAHTWAAIGWGAVRGCKRRELQSAKGAIGSSRCEPLHGRLDASRARGAPPDRVRGAAKRFTRAQPARRRRNSARRTPIAAPKQARVGDGSSTLRYASLRGATRRDRFHAVSYGILRSATSPDPAARYPASRYATLSTPTPLYAPPPTAPPDPPNALLTPGADRCPRTVTPCYFSKFAAFLTVTIHPAAALPSLI